MKDYEARHSLGLAHPPTVGLVEANALDLRGRRRQVKVRARALLRSLPDFPEGNGAF